VILEIGSAVRRPEGAAKRSWGRGPCPASPNPAVSAAASRFPGDAVVDTVCTMAIPRRLLVVAASAVAAGVVWYVTKRSAAPKGRSPIDEGNDEKDRAEAEAKEKKKQAEQAAAGSSSSSSSSASQSTDTASKEPAVVDSARKELALFLSGDAWHAEIGWQALWEKDGVAAPDAWLRDAGKAVLVTERQKLTDHPALLAGCRRRWIVVCRYAGIDVGEAAGIWNDA
jgi:hypothetical protein